MCVFLQCAVIILGKVSFGFFGSSTLPLSAYDKMISEAMHFILACYNMSHCQDLTQARQELWKIKMAKCLAGPPKLCSLPPTTEAFTENAKRAHLQLAVWYHALDSEPPHLDPKNHGWTRKEDSTSLCPSVIPQGTHLAPDELVRLIKCSCASTKKACKSGKCSCVSTGLSCTLFCSCKGGVLCHNRFATSHFYDD